MGSLKLGDKVLTPNNEEAIITHIHEQGFQDVYLIEFIDGSKVECTKEHLWSGHFARRTTTNKPFSTEEIIKSKDNFLVPLPDKLDFGNRYNSIHPYVIGVMLGDGNSNSFKITTSDIEIIERIKSFGFKVRKTKELHYSIITKKHNSKGYCYSDEINELRNIGVLGNTCGSKKIPKEILQGDIWTREECLKGLMDTDGYIDKRGHCEFVSKSEELAKGVQHLVRSLGGKATLNKTKKHCFYNGEKKERIYYRLYIRSNNDKDFFFLDRKKSREKPYNGKGNLHKRIKSITKLNIKKNCRCITLNSKEQTYITDDFTITHNSFIGCAWVIFSCLKYEGSRWLIGRAILKSLKESTLLTFFDICKKWGLKPNTHFSYNAMSGVIKFWNGSEVYLKDLFKYPSDPEFDSLGSTEFTGAFIDEASQVTKKAKDIVASRIRYKLDEFGLIPKLFISSNPSKNFLYTEFYKPDKNNTLPKFRKFIKALVQDNPYISQHYIENLKKLDEVSKQRLFYGNFEYDDDPSKLMEFNSITDIFSNSFVEKTDKNYLVADLAMQGRDRFIISVWNGLRGKIVVDKKKSTGKEIEEDIKQIAEEYKIPRSHIIVDSDGLGAYLESYMKGIIQFHGGSKAYNDKEFANTRSECYFKLAELVNKKEIFIECNERQKEAIISELEQIKRDKVDDDEKKKRIIKKEDIKENIGHSPDYADVLMMRMYFEVRNVNYLILDATKNAFF